MTDEEVSRELENRTHTSRGTPGIETYLNEIKVRVAGGFERLDAKLKELGDELRIRLDREKGDPLIEEGITQHPMLTARQLAALLNTSQKSIYRWEKQNRVPRAHEIGGLLRWDRQEIEAWLRARRGPE